MRCLVQELQFFYRLAAERDLQVATQQLDYLAAKIKGFGINIDACCRGPGARGKIQQSHREGA
ncbi:hypothetical protein D3C73_1633540 [compost metagenome]